MENSKRITITFFIIIIELFVYKSFVKYNKKQENIRRYA